MKQRTAYKHRELKKAIESSRICFEDSCNEQAINSHVLQKNGIISRIAENGQVMECVTDLFEPEFQRKFKKTGVNKVFTFKGFCNQHDNNLFKEIEISDFDLKKYKHQLLFAYRTSVNESRKKEFVIDYLKALLKVESSPSMKQCLNKFIDGEMMGIRDSHFTRCILKANIYKSELNDFKFHYFEIPKIEVCVCGVYTFETSSEIERMKDEGNPRFFEPLTDVFITCLPLENKSVLTIGFLSGYNPLCDEYFNNFSESSSQSLMQYLSDTILLQVENWITSCTFYHKNISPRENIIKSLIKEASNNWDERKSLDINIFND